MSVNTKMTVRCALFAAVSLIIYVIESLLPPLVPVPGARLGLANRFLAIKNKLGEIDGIISEIERDPHAGSLPRGIKEKINKILTIVMDINEIE